MRPEVEESVREEVKLRIEQELLNLEEAFERDRNRGKKKKKGKGKKGKGKKGGKKPKKKGPKEPKSIAALTLDQLYRELIQQQLVQKHPKASGRRPARARPSANEQATRTLRPSTATTLSPS